MDAESNHKVAYILPLSYGLALLKQLLPVPTHIFKKDNHYFEKFDSEEQDDWNVLKTDYAFRCELLETIRKRKVCIISNEKPILYGGVECNEELTLIIGPINIADIDDMPLIREQNVSLTGIDTVEELPKNDIELYRKHKTELTFTLPLKVPAFSERFMDDKKHYTQSNINVCYSLDTRNPKRPKARN